MIDTHVHLDLLDDGPALLRAAAAVGVTDVIGIGVHPAVPSDLVGQAPLGLRIHHTLGLHPQALDGDLDAALALLRERIAHTPVVALGETGLDARKGMPDAVAQERAFRAQLRLGRALDLPVVLHGVRRDGAMLSVFDDEVRTIGPVRAVWHGFSASRETMEHAVKRGMYIAIGFMVLNEHARRVRDAVPHIPRDRLLLETDAPPLLPAAIVDVAHEVARLQRVSVDEIAHATTANARALFSLPA